MKRSGTRMARAGRTLRIGALLVIVGCVGLLGRMHRLAAAAARIPPDAVVPVQA
jgi:hypothetical protein